MSKLVLFLILIPFQSFSQLNSEFIRFNFGKGQLKGISLKNYLNNELNRTYEIKIHKKDKIIVNEKISKSEYNYFKTSFKNLKITNYKMAKNETCFDGLEVLRDKDFFCYEINSSNHKNVYDWYKMLKEFAWIKKTASGKEN